MRKNTIPRLLICITLCAASTALAQTRSGLIRLTRINTQVFVENNQSGEREEKVTEEKITEQNTVVTTGPSSRVILVFSNGATINLAAESQLNIETFQQDPFGGEYSIENATSEPAAKSITKLRLTRGELVGNVKTLRSDLGSEFTVSTPAGAAGIRGTTFRIVYRPDGNGQAFFSVMTLEGDVAVTTTSGTTAAPISVTSEQSVEITVEVDDTTGAVTLVTPIADIVPVTATTEEVAQATASFQESAEAVVAIILTAETDQVPVGQTPTGTDNTGSTGGTSEEETTEGSTEGTEKTTETNKGNSETTNVTNNKKDTTPGAGG